jgi:hypothetical protein
MMSEFALILFCFEPTSDEPLCRAHTPRLRYIISPGDDEFYYYLFYYIYLFIYLRDI